MRILLICTALMMFAGATAAERCGCNNPNKPKPAAKPAAVVKPAPAKQSVKPVPQRPAPRPGHERAA